MSDIKDGGPAFPLDSIPTNCPKVPTGMTLRDYFAANAPVVPDWFLPADYDNAYLNQDNKALADRWFEWRWFYADQMLVGREVQP